MQTPVPSIYMYIGFSVTKKTIGNFETLEYLLIRTTIGRRSAVWDVKEFHHLCTDTGLDLRAITGDFDPPVGIPRIA